MNQTNSNLSPILRGFFNGILIAGSIIPSVLIIFTLIGLIDVSHIFKNKDTMDYEFVCFDQSQCFLRLNNKWYIVTDTVTPGTVPPDFKP